MFANFLSVETIRCSFLVDDSNYDIDNLTLAEYVSQYSIPSVYHTYVKLNFDDKARMKILKNCAFIFCKEHFISMRDEKNLL